MGLELCRLQRDDSGRKLQGWTPPEPDTWSTVCLVQTKVWLRTNSAPSEDHLGARRVAWQLHSPVPGGSSLSQEDFMFALSSGLFSLPGNAVSVDWAAVNNSPGAQQIRVTVYQCGIGVAKTPVAPGPVTVTLQPNFTTHNANAVGPNGPFKHGFYYEVVLETNDRAVLPMVNVWSDQGGTLIPGTLITARDFLHVTEP